MCDIRIIRDEKRRQAISIGDLIYHLCSYGSDENERQELIENIICTEDFAECFVRVLAGDSSEECSNYQSGISTRSAQKLRELCSEYADMASRELIKNLAETVLTLKNRLKDAQEHNAKILEDWPEAYKKYMPKSEFTYSSQYLTDSQVTLLIEQVATKQD